MRATLLVLLLMAGCSSARKTLEPLPLKLAADDAPPLALKPLDPEQLAERVAQSVVRVEPDPQAVKSFSEYAHDVGVSFVSMLAQPFTAPLFLAELFFGWIDFSTTWGTGFIVDASGHVITNAHVVGDAEDVTLERADGAHARAKVIAVDEGRDLALLRVNMSPSASLLPSEVAAVGTSDTVKLGQKVVLYGFPKRPWDQAGPPKPTLTAGIVSSLGIDVGEDAPRIQMDAAANHGSSGSPVFDEHGAVIGVITEVADPAAFVDQIYAIPIDDVKKAFFEHAPKREGKGEDGHSH